MNRIRAWFKQLEVFTRRPQVEDDMDEEFRHHLSMETEMLESQGLDPAAAKREALRRFGGVQRYKENVRVVRWTGVIEDFVSDMRFAVRGLVRQFGYSASTIVTLSLGIAAAITIFAAVDAVLLRPLAFSEPERLVDLHRQMSSGFRVNGFDAEIAGQASGAFDFFDETVLYARLDMVMGDDEAPSMVRAYAATDNLFAALGISPALGRGILPSDTKPGAPPVAVLSHDLWTTLGKDPTIVGQDIRLDKMAFEVVGVMPDDARFPVSYQAQAFIALDDRLSAGGMDQSRITILGRLGQGVEPDVAAERAGTIFEQVHAERGDSLSWRAGVELVGAWRANSSVRRALWMVSGAVALMLLVAIVDGVNLLLVRLVGRGRELAVRHALGAGSGRLLRHLLTESLVLSLVAGTAAVSMATLAVAVLNRTAPDALTVLAAHRIDVSARVWLFGFGLTVATGLALGVVPALLAIRGARSRTVSAITPYGSTSRSRMKLRSSLLVAQVALTMVLLSGGGLLGMSFLRLTAVDPGFDRTNLAFLHVDANARFYPDEVARSGLADRLETQLEALPGVVEVTRAWTPLSSGFIIKPELQAEGDAEPRSDSPMMLPSVSVQEDYLPAVGARLMAGRNFLPSEMVRPAADSSTKDIADFLSGDPSQANVAIIDQDLAKFLWPEDRALGRRFRIEPDDPWLTVVGVLDELLLGPPDGSLGDFALLMPGSIRSPVTHFSIRSEVPIETLLPQIRAVVRAVDPAQPVSMLETADWALGESVSTQRFFLLIVAVLAAVALVLAGAGLYGVLAVGVSQRRRELGIRMALGARAEALRRSVLGRGILFAAVGTAVGLAGAVVAGKVIESLLFGITANDPLTLVLVSAMMLAVAAAASLLPAWRVMGVDPAETLRAE